MSLPGSSKQLAVGLPLLAILLAAACAERAALTDPRALHAPDIPSRSVGALAPVVVCKKGPPGQYQFPWSAPTAAQPNSDTQDLQVTDGNRIPCAEIWEGTVRGMVPITITEDQGGLDLLKEIDVTTTDNAGNVSTKTVNGPSVTVTPAIGVNTVVTFVNQFPPGVCQDEKAVNYFGPLPCIYPPPPPCPPNSITSNFNGTPVAGGNYVWFNAVFKPKGVGPAGGTVNFSNGAVTFTSGGTSYTVAVPPSIVTFSPGATTASTTFDGTTWHTTVPVNYTGNIFLGGAAFPVPAGGLPGGTNPVVWSETMTSNISGMTLNWQWGAAVYTSFSADLSLLGVKPVDSNSLSAYLNSDHAGTPENFKSSVTGGARGGGGSNFTGSYSGTGSNTPCPAP